MRQIKGFAVLLAASAGVGGLAAEVAPPAQAVPAAALSRAVAGQPASVSQAAAIPYFGNPTGHFPVPAAGRAVDTSHPTQVIGNGTPGSCTSAAVVRAVAAGGIIRFRCGSKPVTIPMTATAVVPNTRRLVVLDGGGLITLSGRGSRRILFSDTCAGKWSTGNCVNQPFPQIVVQNITFEDGYSGARQVECTTNSPNCWYGGVVGGGAIYVEGGQFKAVNSRFISNRCYSYGPDLGGGAIRVLAQYENRPVYITADTFTGGRCSNGGALSSIRVQWSIYNSLFTGNAAVGWGANPAARGTAGGGSGGAIYNDGAGYNTFIAGTVMSGNSAREGGGAIFYVNFGWGNLTLDQSHLQLNPSGVFETAPGIYDLTRKQHKVPVMIDSTVK